MNPEQFYQKLIELNACEDARVWALGKSWHEVYSTCNRGDWLLWLFVRTNDMTIDSKDFRLSKLAAGHCANLVRDLMEDQRSINAVDMVIKYGNGEVSYKDLQYAAYTAADAAAAVYASAVADAKKEMQQKTADVVRSIIKIENYNL